MSTDARNISRALRRAGYREVKFGRNKLKTPGFQVAEWRYPRHSLTVYYHGDSDRPMSIDDMIAVMNRYQKAIHAGTRGYHASVHVQFPCSIGGVHICIDLH